MKRRRHGPYLCRRPRGDGSRDGDGACHRSGASPLRPSRLVCRAVPAAEGCASTVLDWRDFPVAKRSGRGVPLRAAVLPRTRLGRAAPGGCGAAVRCARRSRHVGTERRPKLRRRERGDVVYVPSLVRAERTKRRRRRHLRSELSGAKCGGDLCGRQQRDGLHIAALVRAYLLPTRPQIATSAATIACRRWRGRTDAVERLRAAVRCMSATWASAIAPVMWWWYMAASWSAVVVVRGSVGRGANRPPTAHQQTAIGWA
jgi:hypothetical protein